MPLFDNEAATFLAEVYQRADPFLFGRRTYCPESLIRSQYVASVSRIWSALFVQT
jgi:hypothetical protein